MKGSLERESARLLGAAELRAGLESLFDDYFSLVNLASVAKSSSDFPEYTHELVEAMRQETLLNLDSAARGGADFRRVFNASKTFVNRALARLYGIAGVTGKEFAQVDLHAVQRGGDCSATRACSASIPTRA